MTEEYFRHGLHGPACHCKARAGRLTRCYLVPKESRLLDSSGIPVSLQATRVKDIFYF